MRPHSAPSALRRLLREESAGGLVLMAAAALALVIANSRWSAGYTAALEYKVIGLSVQHWINDAPMAGFFLLVGLEIKRELLDGQLATWPARVLPGVAALGGMIAPALLYAVINAPSGSTLRGWAIPTATDIAFSLGVLALLGSRVPVSLKIFLTALAIIDDLGAVVIIAVFYSADLSPLMLALAALTLIVLVVVNYVGVMALWLYLALGFVLWVFVLHSGVHATVAGVLLALTIPIRRSAGRPDDPESPLHRIENALQPWVAFLVLPIFGFANAGVSLAGLTWSAAMEPVTLGCALGLFVGKQVGVFASVWLALRLGVARLPSGTTWLHLYGLALLCGIGFTMSLFIGLLAFQAPEALEATKIGVLAGSVLSGLFGWIALRMCPMPARARQTH